MKKQILVLLSAIIISIFLISSIQAEIQFWQTRNNIGNGTVENRLSLTYSKNFGIAEDYVFGDNPFEFYIKYNIYVKTFNANNPSYEIDYCNFEIQTWRKLESSSVVVFEENYTDSDLDINNGQYFFKLFDGDQVIAQETCYYKDRIFNDLELPADMIVVTPTSECKACQYYLWTTQEASILKTKSIGDNVVTITGYIQKLVVLNFEIILAFFWIMMILLIFVAIGLIFIGCYWLFIYLNRLGK